MKLFQRLLVAPAAIGLLAPITANANDIAIDSTVTTLTGSQTLTNKTLTSATLNTPTITGDTTFSDGAYDFDIASHDTSNGLKLGGTLVTATAAELNIMDGVTVTAAQINGHASTGKAIAMAMVFGGLYK